MPRRPRFVLPGVPHHITQRGNDRQDVFFADADRLRYLHLLQQNSLEQGVRILGWCLMTNHVHLIAIPETEAGLARALGQTHSQYALEHNRQQGRVGHLWQNRFFSCPLDAPHLLAALHYVELNPVRARLVAEAWQWPWSSAKAHATEAFDELLDWPWQAWFEDARPGKWEFDDWKAHLAPATPPDAVQSLRRATHLGEPLGSETFIRDLEASAGRRLRVLVQGRPPVEKSAAIDVGQRSLFTDL